MVELEQWRRRDRNFGVNAASLVSKLDLENPGGNLFDDDPDLAELQPLFGRAGQ